MSHPSHLEWKTHTPEGAVWQFIPIFNNRLIRSERVNNFLLIKTALSLINNILINNALRILVNKQVNVRRTLRRSAQGQSD